MTKLLFLFGYHVALLVAAVILCFDFFMATNMWVNVGCWGLLGGVLYCVRGLYLNYCVKNEWQDRWILWHIIRPCVSAACGVVSLLFVKAGLLIVEAGANSEQTMYGVYALAFIAGMNVDNFIKKLEQIFKALIGLQETRINRDDIA